MGVDSAKEGRRRVLPRALYEDGGPAGVLVRERGRVVDEPRHEDEEPGLGLGFLLDCAAYPSRQGG
jgi:hypothetical protein